MGVCFQFINPHFVRLPPMPSEAIKQDVRVTVAEYLRLESKATDKHEHRNGRIAGR